MAIKSNGNEISDEIKELLKKENEDIEPKIKDDTNNNENHIKLVEQIIKLSNEYTELEEYLGSLSTKLSDIDKFLDDLLHYVENKDFTQSQALKFVNLLKKKRKERRIIKKDLVIRDEFLNKKGKFDNYGNRQLFLTDIYKKEKSLESKYNAKKITFEEIDDLISTKRGKKSINDIDDFVGENI